MENTPDRVGAGLASIPLDPLRYDGHTDDPAEIAGMLRDLMPEGKRVLDVGCGTGSVTAIVNLGKRNTVVGIEPDPERARLANLRGIPTRCGYLDRALLDDLGFFDVVVFADVLEHVSDPAALLQLALSALNRGGVVLISVPNIAHWTVRWDLVRGRFRYTPVGIMDATHLRWFTRETLEQLFANCGLEVVALRQTAGVDLLDYAIRKPWKWFEKSSRGRVIRFLTRRRPLLFGCQHVAKCVRRSDLERN